MNPEEKRIIKSFHGEIKKMTFEEWLGSAEPALPEGFRDWNIAPILWDHGKEISWAIERYKKHRELHSEKPRTATIK